MKKYLLIILFSLIVLQGIQAKKVRFEFFGTKLAVRVDGQQKYHVDDISGKSLDSLLSKIRLASSQTLLDCLQIKDNRKFNDWAYLLMLKSMSDSVFGENTDESTLFMACLWNMSGYKCKLASASGKLYMLYATEATVYHSFPWIIEGIPYYPLNDNCPSLLSIYDDLLQSGKLLSLRIKEVPILDYHPSAKREIASRRYPDWKFVVNVNKNLVDFYNCYPDCSFGKDFKSRWASKANVKLDEHVQKILYPEIRKRIIGMSNLEALEHLLNLVQTGFEYGYDEEIWGGDRAFFAEETLYYPFSDAEDRVILLSRLVRDILELQVVIIYHAEGHMSMAVCLEENVPAEIIDSCFLYNNEEFIMCDPTYINAHVGMVMPDMNEDNMQVLLLQ